MYCPICFQNNMKIRSNGVIKLAFNSKSRNNSLYTYNLQKETHQQLLIKLREKVVDFFAFYAEFNHRTPIKTVDIYSSDFNCTSGCKIGMTAKVSVIGSVYSVAEVKSILSEEGKKFNIAVEWNGN
jgi:hypothetical protein